MNTKHQLKIKGFYMLQLQFSLSCNQKNPKSKKCVLKLEKIYIQSTT